MDLLSRDAFDTALVVVALVLVYTHSVSASNPTNVVGRVVRAVVSLNPIVYLVVLGLVGVLFMAYGLLYLPNRTD
jgi:hypothetical protein